MSAAGPPPGGTAMAEHVLDSRFYRLSDFRDLLAERPRLSLAAEVTDRIAAGAGLVAAKLRTEPYLYGVNTGFGSLCETRIDEADLEQHQLNHLLSHACGVGEPAPEAITRLVLLAKLLTFRSGYTGISLSPVRRLLDFWNHGLIPAIPRRGTVGASGDLAPLAHLALPLVGHGAFLAAGTDVTTAGTTTAASTTAAAITATGTTAAAAAAAAAASGVRPAGPVLAERGWEPLRLLPKEGLALTNGVQYITGWGLHCLLRLVDLAAAADMVAAVSIQGFSAASGFYDELYHQASHHRERQQTAANLRRLLAGSNHHALPTCSPSQQDPYSFRCLPQVHGAVRQLLGFATETLENEVNGTSDNPLFFPEQDVVLCGGNLHGQSVAFALDILAMAAAELASIAERRTYQLLSGRRGLPDFLVRDAGRNSGLMVAQYTSAALVNENKVLATPASVDTIPTCQLQEDSVSMGGTSAYKLLQAVTNLEYVLGIELLAAAQATDLLDGLELSPATRAVVRAFRSRVAFLAADRVLAEDIERSRAFVAEQAAAWRAEIR